MAAQGVLLNFAGKLSKVASADRTILRRTGKAEAKINRLLGDENEDLKEDVMALLDKARADERQVVASESHEATESRQEAERLGRLASRQHQTAPQQESGVASALLEGEEIAAAEDEASRFDKGIAKATSGDKHVVAAKKKATQAIEQVLSGEGEEQLADIMGKAQTTERKMFADDSHILQVAREEASEEARETDGQEAPRPARHSVVKPLAVLPVYKEEPAAPENAFATEHGAEGPVDSGDRRTNLIHVRNQELKGLRFAAGEVRLAKKDQHLLDEVSEVDEEIQEALSAGDKQDSEAAKEVRDLFGRAGSVLQKLEGRHEHTVKHAKRRIKALVKYERELRDEEEEEEKEEEENQIHEADEDSVPMAEDASEDAFGAASDAPKAPEVEQGDEVPLAQDQRQEEARDDNEQQETSAPGDEEVQSASPELAVQLEEEETTDRAPEVDKEASSLVAEQVQTSRASAHEEQEQASPPMGDEAAPIEALAKDDAEEDGATTSVAPAAQAQDQAEAEDAGGDEHDADAGCRQLELALGEGGRGRAGPATDRILRVHGGLHRTELAEERGDLRSH
jgi:hypothetical protein